MIERIVVLNALRDFLADQNFTPNYCQDTNEVLFFVVDDLLTRIENKEIPGLLCDFIPNKEV